MFEIFYKFEIVSKFKVVLKIKAENIRDLFPNTSYMDTLQYLRIDPNFVFVSVSPSHHVTLTLAS